MLLGRIELLEHLLPEFWQRGDILQKWAAQVDYARLECLRRQRWSRLARPHWQELINRIGQIPLGSAVLNSQQTAPVRCKNGEVAIGALGQLTPDEHANLEEALTLLIPWRKGPFSVCGVSIDAEWRSDFKWQRVLPFLPDLKGKFVADIGCSNGYYMFRALDHQPQAILGLDPSERFLLAFELLQRLAQQENMQYELLGIEEMDIFRCLFDVVFCFGILYHHRDPLGLLHTVHGAMRSGAELIVESQAIPGDEPIALCPPDRYAKGRNNYFIPTASCLASWLTKTGFTDVRIVSSITLGAEEQRKTPWMRFESLSDFLDPSDPSRTIEGFPAPLRVIVVAKKL